MTFCLHYGSRSFETSGLCVYLTIDFLTDVAKIKPSPGARACFHFHLDFKMFISIHMSAPHIPTNNTQLMVSNPIIN